MAITGSTLKTGIRTFLEDLGTEIATKALADVPVIGDLNLPVGSLLFGLLMDRIDDAIDAAGAGIDGLVTALDGIEGIEASLDGGDLSVRFSAKESLDLIDEDFGIGGFVGGVGLEIDGAFQTTLSAELDASLRIDQDFGEVFLVDVAGVKEVTVALESHLSVDAEGKLGFLDITAVDHDPDAPELLLSASFDLPPGRAADAFAGPLTPDFAGTAGIDLDLVASLANGALPEISTNFVIEFDLEGGSPKIAFNDISIDLSSILGVFGGLFGTISDVLDSGPLGEILDLITGPLPVIDGASEDSGFDEYLDTLPELIKDGDISLADLFVKFADSGIAGDQFAPIADYLKKVSYLDLVRDIAADLEADGAINVGSFSIGDDPLDAIANFVGIDPVQILADFNQAILDTGIFDEVPDLAGGFTDELGLTLPLFDNPSLVVNILFNQLFDPVTIVQLDLPKLELPAQVDLFFPIVGPIGLGLKAGVNASVDLSFGFDTAGIATGDFLEAIYAGLYVATTDAEGTPVPGKIAAEIDAVLKGYAGVDIGIASLKIGGGLNLLVEAYLRDADGDGKTRLADFGDCFLDPLTGRAWADLEVVGKIGVGFFSASKTITIAKAEFADFNYTTCEPAVSPIDRGLARIVEGAETDLLLHTGILASLREIGKDTGGPISYLIGDDLFVPEYYMIGNAVDEETGASLPGVLAVSAFGAYQVFGSAEAPVERITGNLGALADSLIVASDVLQAVVVGAGTGNDFVIGGGGNDEISGEAGEDQLQGGAGDDVLDGGADDDTLYGGAGADTLVGGSGFDDVSYEAANAGTGVGVRFYRDTFGSAVGFGGEAEGDRLEGIEQITGTAFDDELTTGDQFTGVQFVGKTLFGLGGNDRLIGGFGDDFLLGGEGGDLLAGALGRDATSYVFSRGSVVIDLSTGTAYGGEATGDVLSGIEVVQGSIFADSLTGDAANNEFDGSGGDDVLEGGAGADILYGNVGDDTIFGGADGDTLDGSLETPQRTTTDTGTDLLSYSRVEGSGVTVDILEGFAHRNDNIFIRDRIVSEGRYLDVGGVTYTLLPGDSTFENLIGTA
ncbi:MAG: hypothetical protein H7Y08_07415, partial [Rhizobiaceae bacterium]|nr:hypothetical protein [Rhizobiaceae bacterium]